MKSTHAILLFVLVLLLAAGGFWALDSADQQRDLAVRSEAESTQPDASAELDSSKSDLATATDGEKQRRGDATQASASEVATLEVAVIVPSDSPTDDSLRVIALTRETLGDNAPGTWLANADGEHFTARVDGSGSARLELPIDEEFVLLLDGKYLFIEEAAPAVTDVRLEAQLGAFVSGSFTSSQQRSAAGSISLMGMRFDRRGGGQTRKVEIAPNEFEFRAIDTSLTWMLLPELETGFADSEMGLELTPGEETSVTLELLAGATVRGVVVDDAGAPLANAEVKVANDQPWMPSAGNSETESDAQGEFVLTGLAPGKREIQASLDGRLRVRSEKLELADGDEVSDLRLTLKLGAAIRGTVRYPDGTPAAGAGVEAEFLQRRSFGGFGRTQRRTGGEAETDADGSFVITGLNDGRFTLRAQHEHLEGDATATWRATTENVEGDTQAVELVLSGPVPFNGKVVDDLGEPITVFEIRARSAEDGGPREQAEFEDEEGRFNFAKCGAGDWRITASAEGHSRNEAVELKLPAGETELVITLARTGSISGRVVDASGTPVSEATVRYEIADGNSNPWGGRSGPNTEVDAGGTFSLQDLKAGSATLVAEAEGWADSEAVAVDLPPGGRLEDVVLSLRVGGHITGSVLTPEGDPIAGRRVTWGSNSMGFGSKGETKSAADGSFEFDHVTPGEWSVTAAPSMAEMGKQMSKGDAETAWVEVMGQMLSESITVADGESVEVYLGGEPRFPVRIVGSVTRAGEPIEGAQVFAVSEGTAVFQGMKTVRTEADGSYSLEVDRPGAYVVSAREGVFGVEIATDIPRVEETRVDLLIPLGSIQGFIEKPDGTRAKGIRMRLQREDGLGRMRFGSDQARTDEEGHYAFDALEPGRYTVRANIAGWNGRADERFGTGIHAGVVVREDGTTNGIDFELTEAGSIAGLVEGTDGSPVAEASIFFRDASGIMVSNVSGTSTDGAGRFKKDGLAPGNYTLSVRADELASEEQLTVRVNSGEDVEAKIVVEKGTRVRVILEDGGGAAQRARVEVFDKDGREVGGLITLKDMQRMFNEGSSTLERVLGPLAPGRYTVRATTLDGKVSEKKVRLRGRRDEKKVKLTLED